MEKIPVFVGDVHCNASAMVQIINYYNPQWYELYWLGDFLNSKNNATSDKEVELIIHTMLENCTNVLHSNHMHILYEYLSHLLFGDPTKPTDYTWRGWHQTKRVVRNLHPSAKRRLIDFMKNSRFMMEISYNSMSIAAAHSIPKLETIGKIPSVHLNNAQMYTIGMRSVRNFWKQKLHTEQLRGYNYVICGHHGLVSRFGNVRLCDLRGVEVPVWQAHTDTFKLFPF